MNRITITTSWDDGHKLDLKLADLLDKYGIKGTFYISKNYFKNNHLSDKEILVISKNHEIGAHTVNHPNLTKISINEAEKEIAESKVWLESVMGKSVKMFCYPFGSYDDRIIDLVKKAGFIGARTTQKFVSYAQNPYQMGTTLQVYPFPFRKLTSKRYYWRYLFQPLSQNLKSIRKFKIPIISLRNWTSFSETVFNSVQSQDYVFHLWGHSWEIEKYGMWNELEDFLQYISDAGIYKYLSNGALIV